MVLWEDHRPRPLTVLGPQPCSQVSFPSDLPHISPEVGFPPLRMRPPPACPPVPLTDGAGLPPLS